MSYLRMTQEGQYVDIPKGSAYYLYDNGSDIGGWSYEEWAALIGGTVYKLGVSEIFEEEVREAFAEHYGGWDEGYSGGITPPERAEIFCQCVDSRIDGVTLTDGLHEAAQEWADSFDALRECEYCDEEIRPYIYNDSTSYFCDGEDCNRRERASRHSVTVSVIERAEQVYWELMNNYGYNLEDASDAEIDYIIAESPKEYDE